GGARAAEHEAPRYPEPRIVPSQQRAAGDAREEAEQERQGADRRRGALRLSVVLEQRHDPVADEDAEAERERVDRTEPVQPAVAEDTGPEPLARMTGGSRRRRCERERSG